MVFGRRFACQLFEIEVEGIATYKQGLLRQGIDGMRQQVAFADQRNGVIDSQHIDILAKTKISIVLEQVLYVTLRAVQLEGEGFETGNFQELLRPSLFHILYSKKKRFHPRSDLLLHAQILSASLSPILGPPDGNLFRYHRIDVFQQAQLPIKNARVSQEVKTNKQPEQGSDAIEFRQHLILSTL